MGRFPKKVADLTDKQISRLSMFLAKRFRDNREAREKGLPEPYPELKETARKPTHSPIEAATMPDNDQQPEQSQGLPGAPEDAALSITEQELVALHGQECSEATRFLIEKYGSPDMCIDYVPFEDWKLEWQRLNPTIRVR